MLSFFKKNKNYKICAAVSGNSINIEKVNDATFSQKLDKYIEKEFKYKLDKSEKVYLLLHLTKIL